MSGKVVRLGAGMAFWGDSVRPAIEMVERGDIDYLCCDHLAELTMSILAKQRAANPERGYTRDVIDLLRGALPACVEKGVKVVTNAGGANPRAAARAIRALADELGLPGVRIAVVLGDDIEDRIDDLDRAGVSFRNLDTGAELDTVRDRLTHAAVYTGCEGIVEALDRGADIVVCGRVTDIALYLGPLVHEFGWSLDDWERLGMATVVAHAIECGGQATGGLYAGGWADVDGLETLGYPIAEVSEDGTAVLTKTPGSGGEVSIGTVSEQLVYEILDPGYYLTADVTADFTQVTLEEVGPDRVRITGGTGASVRRRSRSTWATAPGSSARRSSPTPGPTPTPRLSADSPFCESGWSAPASATPRTSSSTPATPRCGGLGSRRRTTLTSSSSSSGMRRAARTRPRPARSSPRACRSTTTVRPVSPESGHGRRSRSCTRSGPAWSRASTSCSGSRCWSGHGGRAVRVADLAHGRSGDKGDTCNVGIVA